MAETKHNPAAKSADPAPSWAGVFVNLLAEQSELLTALDVLSRRQRSLIAGEAPDELVALMDERQHIVDRLESLTTRLTPMHTRWAEGARTISQGQRSEIETRLKSLASLAREIAARDVSDQELIARRKQEIAQELASTSGNQKAMHAYAGSSPSGGAVFQDREA